MTDSKTGENLSQVGKKDANYKDLLLNQRLKVNRKG